MKQLDREREASPDWCKGNKALGVMLYINCFGDTLCGVREHLPYPKESGTIYIHLMPLLAGPKGRPDSDCTVADFRTVEPELGTMEDFVALVTGRHKNGMNICLDFALNHASEDHGWVGRAKAGEKEFQDRYFFFGNWNIPNDFGRTVPQVFPTTAPGNFSWCNAVQKVVTTTFYPYQWDLDYANPTISNDMTENLFFLYNQKADIVRLDAVPYIWKALGTTCRNLPQIHTLVRIMRMAVGVMCPTTQLLSKVIMEPSKVVPYFGALGKLKCNTLYNVTTMATTWHTVATRDVRLVRHQLGQIFALPKQYLFLNYLRCHNDIGWGLDYGFLKQFGGGEIGHEHFLNDFFRDYFYGSDARGGLYSDDPRIGNARLCGTTALLYGIEAAEYEDSQQELDRTIRLDIMLHAFLFTLPSVPMIYSGDKAGQRSDYSYHEDPCKWDDSRYLHRGDFSWKDAEKRKDPTTQEGRVFTALRELETIRATHKVFRAEADTWVMETYNDHILDTDRYYNGEELVVLFNFSVQDGITWINKSEKYRNLLNSDRCRATAYSPPAFGFVWLHWNKEKEIGVAKQAETAREAAERQAKKERKTAARKRTAERKKAVRQAAKEATTKAETEGAAAEQAAEEATTKAATEEAATKAEAEETAAKAAAEEAAARAMAEETARRTVEAIMKTERATRKSGTGAKTKRTAKKKGRRNEQADFSGY